MRSVFITAIFVTTFLPIYAFALCSSDGYTIVYINGILTSKSEADNDKDSLQRQFIRRSDTQGVAFRTGYNASHLAGAGDLYKSIQQALQEATPTVVTDY